MKRRDLLKTAAVTGGAAVVGGGTLAALSGGAAAANVKISSSDVSVKNDRGDLQKITINPSVRVEWEDFDVAVGKVMLLIEGRTFENGSVQGEGWTPVFRATPWLTKDIRQNGGPFVDYSKPGTTGYYEIDGVGDATAYASRVRTGSGTPNARPIEVVNEAGRPDYQNLDYSYAGGVDAQSFLAGNSLGGAGDVASANPNAPLVNNFPGADAGYYGAVIDTDNFDVPKDGTSDKDEVELRYTLAFYTVNWPLKGWYSGDPVGTGWMENVRQSDLQVDGQGNSKLVMDGTDGYPSVTNNGANSPASIHYDALQAIAGSHPSVVVDETSFMANVINEQAQTKNTNGTSATGASGKGQ